MFPVACNKFKVFRKTKKAEIISEKWRVDFMPSSQKNTFVDTFGAMIESDVTFKCIDDAIRI